jgi:hypothetical protein
MTCGIEAVDRREQTEKAAGNFYNKSSSSSSTTSSSPPPKKMKSSYLPVPLPSIVTSKSKSTPPSPKADKAAAAGRGNSNKENGASGKKERWRKFRRWLLKPESDQHQFVSVDGGKKGQGAATSNKKGGSAQSLLRLPSTGEENDGSGPSHSTSCPQRE